MAASRQEESALNEGHVDVPNVCARTKSRTEQIRQHETNDMSLTGKEFCMHIDVLDKLHINMRVANGGCLLRRRVRSGVTLNDLQAWPLTQ